MSRKTKILLTISVIFVLILAYLVYLPIRRINSCSSILKPPVLSAITKDDVLKSQAKNTSCLRVIKEYPPQKIQECIKRSVSVNSEVGAPGLSTSTAIELCSNGYTARISEEDKNNLNLERLVAEREIDVRSFYTMQEALGVDDVGDICERMYPVLTERGETVMDEELWYSRSKYEYKACLELLDVGLWFSINETLKKNRWE